MIKRATYLCIAILLTFAGAPGSSRAETVELVTYYPSQANTGDLHVRSLTVGEDIRNDTPPNGVALIFDELGIGLPPGTVDPAGPLHVVGVDDTASNALFLPGQDTGADGTPEIRVGIGTANPAGALHVVTTGQATARFDLFSNVATQGPEPATRRARGTPAAPLAVQNGDDLGGIGFAGHDGADFQVGAVIDSSVEGAPAAGNVPSRIDVATNDGTSLQTRLSIRANGNVGVGMRNPTTRLELPQFSAIRLGHAYMSSGVGNAGQDLAHFSVNSWWDGAQWVIPDPGHRSSVLQFQDNVLVYNASTTPGGAMNARRFTIDSNGRIGIGVAGIPEQLLHVRGIILADRSSLYVRNPNAPAGTRTWGIVINGANGVFNLGQAADTPPFGSGALTRTSIRIQPGAPTNSFIIASDGTISGRYGTYHTSDLVMKKEIAPIPDALGRLLRLRGVTFRWKDPELDQQLQIGLVGQEVERVFPEVVRSDPDGLKGIAYDRMAAVLLEAVKAQQRQIDDLKQENRGLKARIEKLEEPLPRPTTASR